MGDLVAVFFLFATILMLIMASARTLNGNVNALTISLVGAATFTTFDVYRSHFLGSGQCTSENGFILSAGTTLLALVFLYLGYLGGKGTFIRRMVSRGWMNDACMVSQRKLRRLVFLISPLAILPALVSGEGAYVGLAYGVARGILLYIVCVSILSDNKLTFWVAALALSIALFGDDSLSSRRSYIAVFLPLFVVFAIKYRVHGLRAMKLSLRSKVLLVATVSLVFLWLNYMRAEHDFGEGFDPNDPVGNTLEYVITFKSIDTFCNTAFLIDKIPDMRPYYYGETYAAVFVALIPRSFWPNKPTGLGAPLGVMYKFGEFEFSPDAWLDANMFSLSPGLVGEAYANGGFLGVALVSWLVGVAIFLFDKTVLSRPIGPESLPYLGLVSFFFLVFRGDFYAAMNFPLFLFVGMWLASRWTLSGPRGSVLPRVARVPKGMV